MILYSSTYGDIMGGEGRKKGTPTVSFVPYVRTPLVYGGRVFERPPLRVEVPSSLLSPKSYLPPVSGSGGRDVGFSLRVIRVDGTRWDMGRCRLVRNSGPRTRVLVRWRPKGTFSLSSPLPLRGTFPLSSPLPFPLLSHFHVEPFRIVPRGSEVGLSQGSVLGGRTLWSIR